MSINKIHMPEEIQYISDSFWEIIERSDKNKSASTGFCGGGEIRETDTSVPPASVGGSVCFQPHPLTQVVLTGCSNP